MRSMKTSWKTLSILVNVTMSNCPEKWSPTIAQQLYENALSRLRSQVRKLEKDPEVLREYHHMIKDQLEKGIVEKVPDQEVKAGKIVHYLPH